MLLRRSIALLLIAAIHVPAAHAQKIFERKRPEIIPTDGKMRRGGLYFGLGATYTLTRFNNTEEELFRVADTVYNVTFDPNGRFGFYAEAGWFHATRDPVILDYWDFGLAYKQLNGEQAHDGLLHLGLNENDTVIPTAGSGRFAEQYLTLHVNANKFFQVGDYSLIQLTLGANADWDFSSSRNYDGDVFVVADQEFPPDLIAQVHVKVGYGFKVSKRLLIIPALETPFFNAVPIDKEWGNLQWFNSRYHPFILSVRFLFLRYPKGFDCPPPIRHNRFEKSKEYKPDSYHP
ncbi:MAG: hypothetical protein H6595_07940 [Flavobacteriales bacterium]|nr:hypothetical protein [Flavobacteriales bacterium]MCB9167397.1 hypothetical protein [Flavobacteriales bacterium]